MTGPLEDAALRPLTGLVGRGSDIGRLLGHADAGRSVRLLARRGSGTTALLRSLCAEPSRPAAPDGVLALPAGLPLLDLPEAARRLRPDDDRPLAVQRLLVMLDDPDLDPRDVERVAETFPSALLLVTGMPDSDPGDLTPLPLQGLSEHHAVGLMEAAVGHSLTLDEGRAARWVAAALEGLPIPLVQAAAAVRDGDLSFSEVRDLLDDPVRPGALTVALQNALDDDLHITLTTLAALGDVPSPTPVVAAALDKAVPDAVRHLRRLALLGLVTTDGRDGWSTVEGVGPVSPSLRADAADRLVGRLGDLDQADLFTTASVLSMLGERVRLGDHVIGGALAGAALARLPLDGLDQTRQLLEQTRVWAAAVPAPPTEPPPAPDTLAPDTQAPAADAQATPTPVGSDGLPGAVEHRGEQAESTQVATLDSAPDSATPTGSASPHHPDHSPLAPDLLEPESSSRVAALLSDWRRLATVAVVAAAVVVGGLLVAPALNGGSQPTDPVQTSLDLGRASLGQSSSASLQVDLAGQAPALPVALAVSGPDADAFTVSPTDCQADCRATVTFTPDRSGAALASVTGTDTQGRTVAVVDLTASGSGDEPAAPADVDLAVTLFPAEPSPLPAGGSGVIPVRVTNNGPDAAPGAELVVTVPDGVSAEADGCSFRGTTLTCALVNLPVDAEQRLALALEVPAGSGPVKVEATVSPGAGTDPDTSNSAAGFTYPVG
jgi:hypothetical protein